MDHAVGHSRPGLTSDALRMTPRSGFCARTRLPLGSSSAAGDCNRDDTGSLWIAARAADANSACRAHCEACARCRYTSLSTVSPRIGSRRLCTWHAHCDLDDLRSFAGATLAGANWTTMQFRRRVPKPWPHDGSDETSSSAGGSAGSSELRLAIATLAFSLPHARKHVGGHFGQGCALDGWCQGAARLRRALADPWRVSVLILYGVARASNASSNSASGGSNGSGNGGSGGSGGSGSASSGGSSSGGGDSSGSGSSIGGGGSSPGSPGAAASLRASFCAGAEVLHVPLLIASDCFRSLLIASDDF